MKNVGTKTQEIIVNLTLNFVSHPNPERGVDLLAGIVLKQLLVEEANTQNTQVCGKNA
jgi:hypothetical protein